VKEDGSMMLQFAKSGVVVILLTALTGTTGPKDNVQANQEAPKDEKVVRYAMPILKPLQTTADWSGCVLDGKLRAAAPEADHVVRDAMTWQKLWKAWNGDRELPKVNFKEEVLFVFTARGPNVPCLELYLCGGNVCGTVGRTCKGGPGFGYRIVKVPQKEIKSLFGRPIE
jgi:hypothetical protein